MEYIYADHAATTPLMPEALEAMEPWLTQKYGNASSLSRYGAQARKAVENARRASCALLGADDGMIYFTGGGTESNVSALRSAADAGIKSFVCSMTEHHSVINTVRRLGMLGCRTQFIAPDENGVISADKAALYAHEGAVVSVMLANNETGCVQPVAEIARAVHERGALLHCDCVQAAGHIKLDLKSLGADYASFSAHKFGGPKGCGMLYIRRGAPFLPIMTGGEQERGMRAGTENVSGIVGMAAALEKSCEIMESESLRIAAVRDELTQAIMKIPGSRINSRAPVSLPGIINAAFDCVKGEDIATVMDQKGVAVSPGSACAAGSHEPSHVLTAMGLDRESALGAIRISLGSQTKPEHGALTAQALAQTVDFLRSMSPVWNAFQR